MTRDRVDPKWMKQLRATEPSPQWDAYVDALIGYKQALDRLAKAKAAVPPDELMVRVRRIRS